MLRYDDLQVFVTPATAARCPPPRAVGDFPGGGQRGAEAPGKRAGGTPVRPLHPQPAPDSRGRRVPPACPRLVAQPGGGAPVAAGRQDQIAGVLQLSAPSDFGRNLLLPWLDEFQARYPQLSLRLLLGDRVTDLYRQPVDVAIRYGTGRLQPGRPAAGAGQPASALRRAGLPGGARRAAPAGRPARAQLPALPTRRPGTRPLGVPAGPPQPDPDGRRRPGLRRRRRGAALGLAGKGLVYKSWLDVAEDVRAGRLRLLLPEWRGEATPMNLLCTHRAQLTRPVTLLRAFVRERCDALLAEAPWTRN